MTRELGHPRTILDTLPADATAGQRVKELGKWLHKHERTFVPFSIAFMFDADGHVTSCLLSGESA